MLDSAGARAADSGWRDEGKAHIPAQHPPSGTDARVPGPDEHEERASGSQTAPGQGAQAADGQQRVARPVRSDGTLPAERAHSPARRNFNAVYDAGHPRSWPVCHAVHPPQQPDGRPAGCGGHEESWAAPFKGTGRNGSFERYSVGTSSPQDSTSLSCRSANCSTPSLTSLKPNTAVTSRRVSGSRAV